MAHHDTSAARDRRNDARVVAQLIGHDYVVSFDALPNGFQRLWNDAEFSGVFEALGDLGGSTIGSLKQAFLAYLLVRR